VPKDIDKQKSQALFSVLGLQSSKGLNKLDFNAIKNQSYNIVNKKCVVSYALFSFSDNIEVISFAHFFVNHLFFNNYSIYQQHIHLPLFLCIPVKKISEREVIISSYPN
jgi:hypothetical protein